LSHWVFPLIFLAGLLSGVINTLAGNGSLVSLAMLSSLGLPSNVANGTNRLGVLVQSVIGTWTFQNSDKKVEWRKSGSIIIATIIGAIIGSRVAVVVNERVLDLFLGLMMVIMFFVILLNPGGALSREKSVERNSLWLLPVFFAIGFYGGFIQAGVGIFLIMGLVVIAGKDLVKSSGIKLIIVLAYTIPVLAIFVFYEQVNWLYGAWLAGGQAVGARISAKFAVNKPSARFWIRRLLLVIVSIAAVRFIYLALNH